MLLLLAAAALAQAQGFSAPADQEADYRSAMDLYQKEQYAAAQQLFKRFVDSQSDEVNHLKSNAEYYAAMCAILLDNDDAEYILGQFIKRYPESQKVNAAYFAMGKIQYQNKRYRETISWLNRIAANGLDREQDLEKDFMLGYSYFMRKDAEPAMKHLYRVKDSESKFAAPATYYYSHIAYQQKNYATALKGFEVLEQHELFAPIVPFYISQIHFLQGDYQRVIAYTPPLVRSSSTKRTAEMARLVGEAYFRLRQYDSALVYFDMYAEKTPQLTRNDHYLMGYALYHTRSYARAAALLERVPTDDDSLAQNANYHLADCYLQTGEPAKARQAFAMASRSSYDPIIQEDALFNFAKLTYEHLYAPFNEAIDAFNRYIAQYPNTSRTDEAYGYLTLAYLNTRNYKQAVEALERIQQKDPTIKAAYQRAAFFRAMELFQNQSFDEAARFFDISLRYSEYSNTLAALAQYWQAEARYRMEHYQQAAEGYGKLILTPGAFTHREYNVAHYNLGYSNFKLKRYDEAIVWFRKFTSLSHDAPTTFVGDAYNRIGDAHFIQRKYWPAIDYYDKAVEIGTLDADYAMFQRGFSLGLVDRPEKKVQAMQSLVERYPKSDYVDDAIFEMAESRMLMGQPEEARANYQTIVDRYAGSSYYVKSLVQLGLICYNAEQNEQAMAHYKRVVEEFPNTPEAKSALLGIRNICVDNGDVDTYFSYASTLGSLGNVSLAGRDSLSFIAAENQYLSGDCARALTALEQYAQSFPNGTFAINAHYYIGDCSQKQGNADRAMEAYRRVVAGGKNMYTEPAYLRLADLYALQGDHAASYAAYDQLESIAEQKQNLLDARVGKLRSASLMQHHDDVANLAGGVLAYDRLPAELEREVRLRLARSLMALQRNDAALVELSTLSRTPQTAEGAEASYLVAKLYFDTNRPEKAEEQVMSFAERNTPHQYWLAKSFIVLADLYAKQDNFFQAKATLQSVIDGYADDADGIKDEARDRLQLLVSMEEQRQTVVPSSDTIRMRMSF